MQETKKQGVAPKITCGACGRPALNYAIFELNGKNVAVWVHDSRNEETCSIEVTANEVNQ